MINKCLCFVDNTFPYMQKHVHMHTSPPARSSSSIMLRHKSWAPGPNGIFLRKNCSGKKGKSYLVRVLWPFLICLGWCSKVDFARTYCCMLKGQWRRDSLPGFYAWFGQVQVVQQKQEWAWSHFHKNIHDHHLRSLILFLYLNYFNV